MPTELIPYGVIMQMNQNQVYSLPANRALFYTDGTTPTIQSSTTFAFTNSVTLTLTNGACEVNGGFIRCTTGNINIILSKV